ncbi:AcrR family transcriptional regulator [Staphylococcus auricularis]
MEEELMTDMRIVKTKRKARKAMITLLKEKKYDDISVKDICETAGISRGTFYLHYKDKYDLVQQYQVEFVKEGTKKALNLLNEERYSFFYQMVKLWNEEAELLLLLISDNGSVEVQNQLKAMLQANAEKHIFPHMNLKNTVKQNNAISLYFQQCRLRYNSRMGEHRTTRNPRRIISNS